MTFSRALSTNNYGPAKFIVDGTTTANGTHSTIAAALTSASSGDTIFIRDGTYTEDLTLKAGVNLTSFGSSASFNNTPKVKIIGKATFTAAGTVTISGIELQTNSDFLLAVTGSVASIVYLNNCYLNCVNNTGISFTTSDATAIINVQYCWGNLGTTGIKIFASTSAGLLEFYDSNFTNTGASITASTITAGRLYSFYSNWLSPITTSSTSTINFGFGGIDTSAQNAICLTSGGSGNGQIDYGAFASGSASAISISNTTVINFSRIFSTNTNAVTGAGTVQYQGMGFQPTGSFVVNTTTQTSTGTLIGLRAGNAPTAGFLGEHIRSAAGTTLVSTTSKDVTSISCTAGVWDISGILSFAAGGTVTNCRMSVNTTSATLGTDGDNLAWATGAVSGGTEASAIVPAWRQTFSATTTVYLVANSQFGTSMSVVGRISATRVG